MSCKKYATVIAILVVLSMISMFKANSTVAVIAVMIGSVLLWHGMWNLLDYIDSSLGISDNMLASFVVSFSLGAAITYIYSSNITDMWDIMQGHF